MDDKLIEIAHDLRVDMLKMFYLANTGHMAPAFSCIDILTELYFEPVINWKKRFSEDRDRVILSKGHACAALYVVLARAEYFSREELVTFYKRDSRLNGHPDISLPGIETATGSLGHGICFGTGTAMAAKLDGATYRTYVVVGDGEIQEGSVWEAAMFASKQKLGNLTVIVDCNKLQASDWVSNISELNPIEEKWKSFGWNVLSVNGHDFSELRDAFTKAKKSVDVPTIIIANTIKGKGISFVEKKVEWHCGVPKGEEWVDACHDLNISFEELKTL